MSSIALGRHRAQPFALDLKFCLVHEASYSFAGALYSLIFELHMNTWAPISALMRRQDLPLATYDELVSIQWEWQAMDAAMSKSPFGGAATGPNPTDRGKLGTKRSALTDGAGIPLALVIDGANRHDVKLLSATLDGVVIERPIFPSEQREQLCLDAAYDSTPV